MQNARDAGKKYARVYSSRGCLAAYIPPLCRDIFALPIYGQRSMNLIVVVFCGLGRSSSFRRE
jgi:hypothetical protein